MSYVSPSGPLPQNGSMPPPASCAVDSQRAIDLARYISQSGRTVVYNTVPTFSSLSAVSPGVARSAALVLPQSELARRSVISGAVPAAASSLVGVLAPAPASVAAGPPEVMPLNWVPQTERIAECAVTPRSGSVMLPAAPAVLMPSRYGAAAAVMGGGFAGYAAPAWSDASLVSPPAPSGLSAFFDNPWTWAGLLGLGLVAVAARRGRR